eukprot:4686373-Amphidinium_carterae.1
MSFGDLKTSLTETISEVPTLSAYKWSLDVFDAKEPTHVELLALSPLMLSCRNRRGSKNAVLCCIFSNFANIGSYVGEGCTPATVQEVAVFAMTPLEPMPM